MLNGNPQPGVERITVSSLPWHEPTGSGQGKLHCNAFKGRSSLSLVPRKEALQGGVVQADACDMQEAVDDGRGVLDGSASKAPVR